MSMQMDESAYLELESMSYARALTKNDRKQKMKIQRAHAAIVALKRCGYLPKVVA